jgi:hypothetical protein
MSPLYSLKQIREILSTQGMHIPDGTLRNYRDDFMDLLPHEGQGRFARYHEDAMGIFKDIREFRKVLRLDTDEIRRRLLERMNSQHAQTSKGSMPRTAQNAHENGPDSAETAPQARNANPLVATDLLNRAAKTEELAGNIDLRTRYLLDSNTKILSVLQHKYAEDSKNAQSLREDFISAMETLRRDQEALTEEVLEMKYMLKQVLNAVSERASWHNKQDAAMQSLPVEELEQGYGSEQKQRGFFDKLMKF